MQRYMISLNHIQQEKPSASLRTSIVSAILQIENVITQEHIQEKYPLVNNRHALKMLILCI